MSARRLTLTATVSLCALGWLVAFTGASASAALTHPYLCQITAGAVPSATECNGIGNTVPGGPFGSPQGVAVDSTGQVYVSDGANKVIDVFDSLGSFTRQITGASPEAPFANPWGVAVDGANNLWTADVGPGLMDKFDSSGGFLAQGTGEGHWVGAYTRSVAFSDASNHLYVADSNHDDLWVLNSDGTFNSDITGPWGMGCCFIYAAADNSAGASGGDIYVTSNQGIVFRIDGAGNAAAFSGSAPYISGAQLTGTPGGSFGELTGVTVDSAGNVYVLDNGNGVVDEFDSTGLFVGQTSGAGTPTGSFAGLRGVAVNAAGNAVYVVDAAGVVDVFGPSVVLPDVTTGGVSGTTNTTATVEGAVNPDETSVTGCAFEYRTEAEPSYAHTTPCAQALPLTGNEPVAVSAELTGLTGATYRYRLAATNAGGTNRGSDRTFSPPGPPTIAGESSEKIGHATATLRAQINPDGRETTYQFQYGETESYGTNVPASPGAIGSGEELVGVPAAELTGLKIGTTYHYRVVASNDYGTVEGPDQTFTTTPVALVDGGSASNVAATSATLNAQINPLGTDTTAYFQYGAVSCTTGPGSCTDLPLPPGTDLGSGESDLTLSVHLQGLEPGTTYHYRVLAANALGAAEGADRTFTTQVPVGGTLSLLDGRQWELVSPPDKHGSSLEPMTREGGDIQASADGGAIAYLANAPVTGEAAGNLAPEFAQILSRRGAGGWGTQDITTPHKEAVLIAVGGGAEYRLFSEDLSLGLVEQRSNTPLSADATEPIYLRDNASGSYLPLVTAADALPPGSEFGFVEFLAGTPDLSHVVLESRRNEELYEWGGGKLQLVSVLPGPGETPAHEPYLGYGSDLVRNAISADGSRIVWEAKEGGVRRLYLRDTARGETVQVDAVQGGSGEGGAEPRFQTAAGDGSKILFTDTQRLTADSTTGFQGPDLYEFDAGTGTVTDLTVDEHPKESADVTLVVGTSNDASYVYFLAGGALAGAAAPTGCGATCNLYVRHDGTTTFIAALSPEEDVRLGELSFGQLTALPARVSPNGRFVAFMSARRLTGYDNRDALSGEPDEEVYLYDAESGRLVCASCNPTGARPVGLYDPGEYPGLLIDHPLTWRGRWLAGSLPGWTAQEISRAVYQPRYLSDSGRLFFDSADALVPQDINGQEDVYEYEPEGAGTCRDAGGCVGLISSGASAEESAFLDASESGEDVFFLTKAQLAPRDHDHALDVYDAHVCSAAMPCPSAAASPPACTTADACRAALAPQPGVFGAPASATFSGAGNTTPTRTPTKTAKQIRAEKLAKALRTCRKKPKKRRTACEAQARKKYGKKTESKAKQSGRRSK